MNNLTTIQVTYIFDYGSTSQERTFITREHFDSLKALTKPIEEKIKELSPNISKKEVKEEIQTLESEAKRIIPSYTFIVSDSQVGTAILSVSEGEESDPVIIPYNDKPTYKIKYKLLI